MEKTFYPKMVVLNQYQILAASESGGVQIVIVYVDTSN